MTKTLLQLLGIATMVLSIASCAGNAENAKKDQPSTPKQETKQTTKTNNMELLQGKWQSVDDKSNFVIFENNHRKEISAGMDQWDDEEFILSDRCTNEGDKTAEEARETDRYISLERSDMCWYIIEISDKKLSLSYVGRGNTLTYKKVKSTKPL